MESKSSSRRRLNAGAGGDYVKAATADTTDGFVNEQWHDVVTEEITPWKTILTILTLFLSGVICIGYAVLTWVDTAGKDLTSSQSERSWALFIIGCLTIIPGAYYTYILACVLLHIRGYSMNDIRRLA